MNKLMAMVKEFNNAMVSDKRNNGEIFYHLKDNSPQWMTDAIFKAHNDRMPDDDIYSRINYILNHFVDNDDESTIDSLRETIDELEPDVYTSDLTKWLHSRVDNVYYITQALEESEFKDGFQLLTYAQSIYIREIAEALLSVIEENLEN